jgi:hypothetical protein
VIKIRTVCEFGHEEQELPLPEAEKVLAEGKGHYLIVKDNKVVQRLDLQDGDVILLVPIIQGG